MIIHNRPLAAFYTYSAACGVFSCISTGLFMPVFLERKLVSSQYPEKC
jgi:hypothetical protein